MAKKEKLDYPALLKQLKAEGPGQLYLLWGEEDFLRESFVSELRKLCLGESDDGFDYKRIDGAEPDIGLIREAADAMPFFAPRLYIELRGFDINKYPANDAEQLKAILADLPEFCTMVILLPAGSEPDGRLGLFKAVKKYGQSIEFTAQDQDQLVRWIRRKVRAAGKDIDPVEAQYLIFNCGELMSHLNNELSKLVHYSKGEQITRSDIDAATDRSMEAEVFQLTDALADRKYDRAASVMAELLAKKESPIMLLAVMGRQFRQLYITKTALSLHLGQSYIKEVCALRFDFQLQKLTDAARGFTLPRLRDAVRLCAETDYAMKSSGADDEALLRDLLLKLAVGGAA